MELMLVVAWDGIIVFAAMRSALFVDTSGGEITSPMSEAQREYCISTADWAGEGHYERKELSAMNDKELASALLNAWIMYAQSQY